MLTYTSVYQHDKLYIFLYTEKRKGGKKAKKNYLPLQPGDVPNTFADVEDLVEQFNYKPRVNIEEGIKNFASWYLDYNNLRQVNFWFSTF